MLFPDGSLRRDDERSPLRVTWGCVIRSRADSALLLFSTQTLAQHERIFVEALEHAIQGLQRALTRETREMPASLVLQTLPGGLVTFAALRDVL